MGFFPWAVFLGPPWSKRSGALRRRDAWYDGCVLATCWFGVWFLFWSLCKTKLPHYLLPAYPALALLTACFIDRWQEMGGPDGPFAAPGQDPRGCEKSCVPFSAKKSCVPFSLVAKCLDIADPRGPRPDDRLADRQRVSCRAKPCWDWWA